MKFGLLYYVSMAFSDSLTGDYGFCQCIDPFLKRNRLVHNGGFPKFEVLCCILNMVNATEIS